MKPEMCRVAVHIAFAAFATCWTSATTSLWTAEKRSEHVVVEYSGISGDYANAVCQVVELARQVCTEDYGFDMPRQIRVRIAANPRGKPRLFNDGVDTFSLTVRGTDDMRKPRESGIRHLYGLCHEVGHLAMYRPVNDHSWLSTAAAEGWAHYLGSRLVDRIYQLAGDELWPDSYDFRQDGMARLLRQLEGEAVSPVSQAAGQWLELAKLVDDKQLATVFSAWSETAYEPSDPVPALQKATRDLRQSKQLDAWWEQVKDSFVVTREQSKFAAATIEASELQGHALLLKHDDGLSEGKRSMAGGGHLVRFRVPAGPWYLTSLQVFGSRYGGAAAPDKEFSVWLCDRDFRVIKQFRFPYSRFERGFPEWVKLQVPPTSVPREVLVCIGFSPTAREGVFVHYDLKSSGESATGLPGRGSKAFDHDWLIRIDIDQAKSADALRSASPQR